MAQGSRGTNRVLLKLKSSIEDGRYYEAHQMYRTLYFRYLGQKRYEEILEFLFEGASLLLSQDQQTSGADLALLMLEVLEKSRQVPNEENIEKVSRLFNLLNCNTPERQQYLIRAVRWSSNDKHKHGHPILHRTLAETLWKENNYGSARYHFLRSADGNGCGQMLIELHLLKGYPSEVDLFLAQAVLQYLCLQKTAEASQVFETYTKKHPTISQQKGPPFLLPLLNFLWLLISSIDAGKGSYFKVIREQYSRSLKRDPIYVEYLDRIGLIFFGIEPVKPNEPMRGLFGNLFQDLFGSLADDSDEEMADVEKASNSKTKASFTTEDLD